MNFMNRNFSGLQVLILAVVLLFGGFILGVTQFEVDVFSFAQSNGSSVTEKAYEGENPDPARPEESLNVAKQIEDAFAYASKQARPAVVTIFTRKEVSVPGFPFQTPRGNDRFNDFFRRFFDVPESRSREVTGLGSGVIIRSDGYVLTNHHVIAQADEIEVMLDNRESVKAEVVGSDKESDLAVLKVDRTELPALDFADSDKLRVGEYAIAIGSPFQMQNSVSVGHVSALHRAINAKRFEDLIQTDAAINRGNSGGPLINIEGEIIGINTLILSEGSRGSQGVGFAISSNLASRTAEDLIEFGKVKRPWLGVVIQEITSEMAEHVDVKEGVIVAEVKDGSPADEAGLEAGDIITEFNGKNLRTPHDLQRRVLAQNIGEDVSVTIKNQDGETRNVTVELAELPGDDGGEAEKTPQPEDDQPDQNLSQELGLKLDELSEKQAQELGLPRPVVRVEGVQRGSPANEARLQRGDIILRVARQPVASLEKLNKLLNHLKEQGKNKALLHVRRDSNFFTLLPLRTE